MSYLVFCDVTCKNPVLQIDNKVTIRRDKKFYNYLYCRQFVLNICILCCLDLFFLKNQVLNKALIIPPENQ